MTFTTDERAFIVRGPILRKMAIGGHPVHATWIPLPVAALIGVIGTAVGYLVTHDEFWARAGLWLAGIGAFGGWIAGSIGLIDLLLVTRIRRLITAWRDRKSTRLNSSHVAISYAVFCLKKKIKTLTLQNGA